MANLNTSIEWTNATWSPVRGCSIVSKGCTNCYAMKQAHRFAGPGGKYEGLTRMSNGGPVWTGEVRVVPEMLDIPLHWRKPQRVFVNSMSDLFHEDVPDDFIDQVFAVMALCPQHTFQVLTKRPERMLGVLADLYGKRPLRNVWLGVSVEDQATANERIPLLLETPAAVRWVSAEPLLEEVIIFSLDGPVDVPDGMSSPLHWIVVGGESGHGARAFDVAWARSIVEQCKAAGVPVFMKQLGANPAPLSIEAGSVVERLWLRDRKGGDMEEWPADLRIREFPNVHGS